MESINLSEIIAVKICHDLAGALGAINNGLELMQDDSLMSIREESINLVNTSAKEAISKLLYFRQAYGTANIEGETSHDNLKNLVNNFFIQNKLTLEWSLPNTQSGTPLTIPNQVIKIFLNALLVVTNGLIGGGTIRINISKQFHKTPVHIHASGNLVKINPEILNLFQKDIEAITPSLKDINAYIAVLLAKNIGSKIALTFDETNINLYIS